MGLKISKTAKPAAQIKHEHIDNSTKTVVAESNTVEVVHVPLPQTSSSETEVPYCEVKVEAGYTHNLGNFQSARIGISLMVPCQHAEIDTVYNFVESWVDARLQKAMADISGGE